MKLLNSFLIAAEILVVAPAEQIQRTDAENNFVLI